MLYICRMQREEGFYRVVFDGARYIAKCDHRRYFELFPTPPGVVDNDFEADEFDSIDEIRIVMPAGLKDLEKVAALLKLATVPPYEFIRAVNAVHPGLYQKLARREEDKILNASPSYPLCPPAE